ncbi:MAG: hypothetical protein WC737_03120 [Parcubacteria group bacterium]|jgi:hypothetical protein
MQQQRPQGFGQQKSFGNQGSAGNRFGNQGANDRGNRFGQQGSGKAGSTGSRFGNRGSDGSKFSQQGTGKSGDKTSSKFDHQGAQGTGKAGSKFGQQGTGKADSRFDRQKTGKSGNKLGKTGEKSSVQGAGKGKQPDTGKIASDKNKPGGEKIGGKNQPIAGKPSMDGKKPMDGRMSGQKMNRPNRSELGEKMKRSPNKEALRDAKMGRKAERAKFRDDPKHHRLREHEHSMVRSSFESHSWSYSEYSYTSTTFYESYGYAPAPWCFELAPYYGVWDTTYLGFVVANAVEMESSIFYYHHRGEEELMAWRAEMDRLAQQDAELAAQLAVLDEQAQLLASQGIAVNPNYVPDAPVFAPEIVEQMQLE